MAANVPEKKGPESLTARSRTQIGNEKQFLPAIVILLILLAFASAPAHADPLPYESAPQATGTVDAWPASTGFRMPAFDLSHLQASQARTLAPQEALPSTWDWRNVGGASYVTAIKDQGTCGSCYAFGYLASLESRLLIRGQGEFDLSENQAKECNWRELSEFQYPYPGDFWGSCDGGNSLMVTNLLSKRGTVLEACDPYTPFDMPCNSRCPYQHTVLDWRLLTGSQPPQIDTLKRYIHTYGPITAAMYVDSSQGFEDYDGSYTINYATTPGASNHSVLIIGWSDNLPPVPGSSMPGTGWIVKNSWGTGWGADGYFFIAYGAANIGAYASYVHDWQAYDPHGGLWFHDEDGWWDSFGQTGGGNTTAWGLARYEVPEDAFVTRVELWTADATPDIDVYVYDHFDGQQPANLLAAKLDSSFSEAGYHSIALDEPLPVSRGNDIAIVVKVTNASSGYPITADAASEPGSGRTYLSISGKPGTWYDLGATERVDSTIRVRTTSTSSFDRLSLVGISPNTGRNSEVVRVDNLAGTGFVPGATVELVQAGQPSRPATNVSVVSPTQITCDLDLRGAVSGYWDVVVTNSNGRTARLEHGFVITVLSNPRIHDITPHSATNAGALTGTQVTGSGFQNGAWVRLVRPGLATIVASNVVVSNSSLLTCDLDLTGAATGPWDVVVTNMDGQSAHLPGGFTVRRVGPVHRLYLPLAIRR
jgi:C1A family cysteine protease